MRIRQTLAYYSDAYLKGTHLGRAYLIVNVVLYSFIITMYAIPLL